MLQLSYHRREEQTIQVLTVNKSIDSFLFQWKDSAQSVEKPSSLGLSVERFRDYSGPCPTSVTVSTQSAPGHRGDLCWTAASCCAHHSPVCVTLARHRAESRKSQVPVHRLPLFPSAALFTDVASTCNPNTSILQVLHYPNKTLENFKKETLTQKYLIIRQLSCSSKWDTALFLRWNPPVHSAFNSPSLL